MALGMALSGPGFGKAPSRAPHHRAAFLKACITAIQAFGVGRGFLSA
jgi:hypothetical protein